VAAGGDGVTAMHVDGGLRAVLSGAVIAGEATPVGKSAHAVQFTFAAEQNGSTAYTSPL